MKQYHDLLRSILRMAPSTAIGPVSGRFRTSVFKPDSICAQGFPIVTTKRVPFRWVAEELFWFLIRRHE